MTGYRAAPRTRRGEASTGTLADFPVEVSEGEVILDVLHRLQLWPAGIRVRETASGALRQTARAGA